MFTNSSQKILSPSNNNSPKILINNNNQEPDSFPKFGINDNNLSSSNKLDELSKHLSNKYYGQFKQLNNELVDGELSLYNTDKKNNNKND